MRLATLCIILSSIAVSGCSQTDITDPIQNNLPIAVGPVMQTVTDLPDGPYPCQLYDSSATGWDEFDSVGLLLRYLHYSTVEQLQYSQIHETDPTSSCQFDCLEVSWEGIEGMLVLDDVNADIAGYLSDLVDALFDDTTKYYIEYGNDYYSFYIGDIHGVIRYDSSGDGGLVFPLSNPPDPPPPPPKPEKDEDEPEEVEDATPTTWGELKDMFDY